VSGSSPYRLAPNCRAPVTRTVVFHPGCQVCLKMGFIWIYDRICREIANSHREIWWTMVTWWYTMVTNGVWGYPIFRQTPAIHGLLIFAAHLKLLLAVVRPQRLRFHPWILKTLVI
jgi:hypothetical protein